MWWSWVNTTIAAVIIPWRLTSLGNSPKSAPWPRFGCRCAKEVFEGTSMEHIFPSKDVTMYHMRFVWQAYGQFRYVEIESVAWNAQQTRLGTRDLNQLWEFPRWKESWTSTCSGFGDGRAVSCLELLDLLAFCLISISWCIVKVKGLGVVKSQL